MLRVQPGTKCVADAMNAVPDKLLMKHPYRRYEL
jgi:hypothetical protein